jgi:hypothetical protein
MKYDLILQDIFMLKLIEKNGFEIIKKGQSMKFKRYINEKQLTNITDVDEFNELLHKECGPYLKMIKKYDMPLKRGMDAGIC